jgi:hypothetical protein
MLWLKSKTSEVWVERRLNYTKSLAATSIVGYILGLGDRHPSNLMLHRSSGRIVHIDFGDCFEVAMNRSKYPETVPFRLTRMLVNAMEVCGIDGTYRSTSVKVRSRGCRCFCVIFFCGSQNGSWTRSTQVMRVLRENRDSVMAMLEAFVHDPLISWRLLAEDGSTPSYGTGTEANDEETRHAVSDVGNDMTNMKAGKVREALERLNAPEPEDEPTYVIVCFQAVVGDFISPFVCVCVNVWWCDETARRKWAARWAAPARKSSTAVLSTSFSAFTRNSPAGTSASRGCSARTSRSTSSSSKRPRSRISASCSLDGALTGRQCALCVSCPDFGAWMPTC